MELPAAQQSTVRSIRRKLPVETMTQLLAESFYQYVPAKVSPPHRLPAHPSQSSTSLTPGITLTNASPKSTALEQFQSCDCLRAVSLPRHAASMPCKIHRPAVSIYVWGALQSPVYGAFGRYADDMCRWTCRAGMVLPPPCLVAR